MKTNIRYPLLLLSLFTTAAIQAQNNELSLDQAIKTALSRRYDLKIQQVNTAISDKQLQEVLTRSLPQLTSDFDGRYNSKLQTNFLPGDVFGGASGTKREVQLGTKFNTSLAFNVNQQVFNPTNIADRKIAALQTDLQRQNEKITEATVKQEVTEAYFSVLLWKEKSKLSETNIQRETDLVSVTRDQLSKGQATNYDVQKNEIDLENAKATDTQNKNSLQQAITDLLYKMSVDSVINPVLTDSITGLITIFQVLPDNAGVRTELVQQRIQTEIYIQNSIKQRRLWLPTLSVYGNYTFQNLNNKLTLFDGQYWYPYNYVGVKASFSLFDGGLKNKTKQEYQLRAQASQMQFEKLKSDYSQETSSALTTLYNSLADLNYQKKNLSLIEELYRLDSDRLKNGTLKQTDLNSTYYTLQQTETNYMNAVYNYLVAVIRYRKANGTL